MQIRFLAKIFKTVYGFLALGLLVLILSGLFVYYVALAPPSGDAKVKLTIRPGWKITHVAEILARKGVVKNSRLFIVYAGYKQIEGFLPGKYELKQGMTPSEAVSVLIKGPIIEKFVVTIPEGFSIKQIAARLSTGTRINGEEFRNQTQNGARSGDFANYTFLRDNPTQTLEGYLFPKTYTITENVTTKEFIQLMLNQYEKETAGLDFAAAGKQRGLTSHNLVTIASLVEAEAKFDEERPLIAAVIYNRLSKNMKLQIDATVQYALPERKPSLSSQDLKVESPYNTYLHMGLPPGPICNPGLRSIQATLNPAPVNYLYYVLTDQTGKHSFTDSYQEFLKLKEGARTDKG